MAERKAEYDAPEQLTDDKKRKAALADALKTIEKMVLLRSLKIKRALSELQIS